MEPGKAEEGDQSSSSVPPLTRCRPNGEIWTRTPAVQAEINAIFRNSPDEWIRRAAVRQRDGADFMSEECLVHLLREARVRGDERVLARLWGCFVARVTPRITSKLGKLGDDHLEEGHSAVIRDIGTAILDLTTDRGDFLQVNFWTAIDRRATSEFRRQRKLKDRAAASVPLSSLAGEDRTDVDEGVFEGDGRAGGERWDDERASALDQLVSAEDQESVGHALASLPPLVRQAFVLRYYEGWKIESNDPTEMTISKALKRSDRQIRNYLAQAENLLRVWREEMKR